MTPAARVVATWMLLLATAAPVSPALAGGGLRTSLGEVVIENLKIGHRYSLKELVNIPLTLTNSGSRTARVAIQPMVPDVSELRMAAEPVPSVSWATVSPDTLTLDAGKSGTADITLTIPDDERWFGHRFQVQFWSHTLNDGSDLIAVGLKSRIIFSVDSVRDERPVTGSGELGIELNAGTLRLDKLGRNGEKPLAQLWDHPWTVRNVSNRSLELELTTVTVPATTGDAANLLDVADLHLEPATITLAPGESRNLSGTVRAIAPRVRGRAYTCAISAAVTHLAVRSAIQSRVVAEAR
jgi:hypothetical protein